MNALCQANIAAKKGKYCNDINPPNSAGVTFCGEIQTELNDLCERHNRGSDYPMVQNSPNGKCYCCCSCLAYRTPIQVGDYDDQEYQFVENIVPGDEVLATNADASGWVHKKVSDIGGIAPELHMTFMFFITYEFADGTKSSIITTADHLFLLPSGKLRAADNLRAGDHLRQADGELATVTFVAYGSWTGGVRSIALGEYKKGDPLDGHLVNSNGVVSADLAVQNVYYGEDLGEVTDMLDRAPIGTPEFFSEHADTAEYETFVNTPELWPTNFVPMPAELINIPASAKGYLSPIQATNVQNNMPTQNPSNGATIPSAQYVFSIASAFYDDIIFLLDWNNPTPNAWYFNQTKQNFIVLTGGLVRLPFMDVGGLSLIVSNLIARYQGAKCTGDADYEGAFDVMRLMWMDDLYIDQLTAGLAQIEQYFDLIDPVNRKEDPNNICLQPSTQCRIDAMNNGSMMRGVPDCAKVPPAFRLDAAFPTANNVVVLDFSKDVDPVTVRNVKNYAIASTVKVRRARADASDQRKVELHVAGLKKGTEYTVTVKNILDMRGQLISADFDSAKFTIK